MAMLADKWVRIMADYCSDGAWDSEGAGGFAPDVPISDALRERLAAWCRRYDETEFYLPESLRKPIDFDIAAFAAEGLEIARAVKAELPDWTVVYFDESKRPATRWVPGTPRDAFEYEVPHPGADGGRGK